MAGWPSNLFEDASDEWRARRRWARRLQLGGRRVPGSDVEHNDDGDGHDGEYGGAEHTAARWGRRRHGP